MTDSDPSPDAGRPWLVKYQGRCSRCGRSLVPGTPAIWERSTKSIRCVVCPDGATSAEQQNLASIDAGLAGASARREHLRRVAKREAKVRQKLGNRLGSIVFKLTNEPHTTRAWAIGAAGEEKLALELANVPGIQILNDLRVPRNRGNIDHLVVAPAGVFVVDAKNFRGEIRIRNRGSIFRSDPGLFVGRRDCTKLAEGLGWQVAAVMDAVKAIGVEPLPYVTPVLCFVDGEWPLLRPSSEFAGVRLESQRSIRKLLTAGSILDADAVISCTRTFGAAFRAK